MRKESTQTMHSYVHDSEPRIRAQSFHKVSLGRGIQQNRSPSVLPLCSAGTHRRADVASFMQMAKQWSLPAPHQTQPHVLSHLLGAQQ